MIKAGGPMAAITILALAFAACSSTVEAPTATSSPAATTTSAATPLPSTQPAAGMLAFSIAGSIYTMRPDGTDLNQLLIAGAERYAAPALSPDGQRLAYIVDRKRVVVTDASDVASVLSEIDLFVDRTPPTPIASNWSMGPIAVHWSPDGEMLLVTRQRLGGSGVSDVLLMNMSGTNLRIVLTSGVFIEATWWPGAQGEPARILVVAADAGLTATIYDLEGEPVGRGLPVTASRSAVASHQRPGAEAVLVTSTLGSPTPFDPIEVEDATGSRVVAEGCGATWSPDGTRIVFYNGYGIAILNVDTPPDAIDLIVSNAGLGLVEEGELREDLCEGLGISWTAGGVNVYRNDELRIEFNYPLHWVEDAAPMPYERCFNCLVFGPPEAAPPYGVYVIRPADLSGPGCGGEFGGCAIASFFLRFGALADGPEQPLTVAGYEAAQQRILRQPPLELTNETGETRLYREVATGIDRDGVTDVIVIAFYREDDGDGEEETLAAYDALLASLRLASVRRN